jgi:hypothetical protein
MGDWMDLLQWPAMAVTVGAGVLVSSAHAQWRKLGFVSFLVSNALWVAWGWHDGAYALIALQLCLCATNLRGLFKSDKAEENEAA